MLGSGGGGSGVTNDVVNYIISRFGGGRSGFRDVERAEVEIGIVIGVFIVYLIVVAFVGKWLFNTVLCRLFTGVKHMTSVWQSLGLFLLLHLLL
jgi:hypothetical protein